MRAVGPAVLPFNSWEVLPFSFSDAFMTFTGRVLVVDRLVGGVNAIYSWGTGVATDNFGNGVAGYLDVAIGETYATLPGNWQFGEINIGSCNAGAVANSNPGPPGPGNASGSVVQGVVNGGGLPVLVAGCGNANPWVLGAGPFGAVNITGLTNLTSLAQFFFNPGLNPGANQAISLPWGDDFPDPTYDGGLFPTEQQLANDPNLTQVTPEPATFAILGGALVGLGLIRRRKS